MLNGRYEKYSEEPSKITTKVNSQIIFYFFHTFNEHI